MQKNIIKTILDVRTRKDPFHTIAPTMTRQFLIKSRTDGLCNAMNNFKRDSWYRLGINNSKLSICFYVFEHLILLFVGSVVCMY